MFSLKLKILSFDFDGTLVYPTVSALDIYYTYLKKQISFSELKIKFRLFEQEYLNSNLELKNKFRNLGRLNEEDRSKLYYQWNYERLGYILPTLSHEQQLEMLKKIMERKKLDNLHDLYPEIKESMNYFKGLNFSLYILSGNNKNFIMNFLHSKNFDSIFDDVLTPDSLQMEKKSIYNYYLTRHTKLQEILHVGDDPELDYHTPKEMGINALWLKRQDNRYEDKTIPRIDTITTIADLKNIIETI